MMFNVIETTELYSATNAAAYPLVLVKAQGPYVFDDEDKRYLDMTSGVAVTNFGHQHPRLIDALTTQASKIAIAARIFHNEPLARLLAAACQLSKMDRAIPMNSGAEAVETAIKLVRKWGYTVKKVPNDKAEIITCDNSFHGRTITTVSLSSIPQYKNDFGPLTPGFISIPFNDPRALEQAITPNTVAFMLEPIQGEAGVILPNPGYLKQCEAICKKNNVMLIMDEIQTGMGRCGKPLALEHDDIHPDGIILGKALGGGLLPISLFLAKDSLMCVIKPGEHGSTFGGNPLAAHVASVAIQTMREEALAENAAVMGKYFLQQLQQIKSPAIREVRGKGLLVAIALDPKVVQSNTVFEQLAKNGVLSINTRGNTIRLLPPLTITQPQLDEALNIIRNTFSTNFSS